MRQHGESVSVQVSSHGGISRARIARGQLQSPTWCGVCISPSGDLRLGGRRSGRTKGSSGGYSRICEGGNPVEGSSSAHPEAQRCRIGPTRHPRRWKIDNERCVAHEARHPLWPVSSSVFTGTWRATSLFRLSRPGDHWLISRILHSISAAPGFSFRETTDLGGVDNGLGMRCSRPTVSGSYGRRRTASTSWSDCPTPGSRQAARSSTLTRAPTVSALPVSAPARVTGPARS